MNVTTLNTTTLDGNVIIKKGGGGTPTPPSGGESGAGLYMKYYDVDAMASSVEVDKEMLISAFSQTFGLLTFLLARVPKSDNSIGGVMSLLAVQPSMVEGMGILYGVTIVEGSTSMEITPDFVASQLGMSLDQFEIPKEEFYNLD